jgi:hypothetical protein
MVNMTGAADYSLIRTVKFDSDGMVSIFPNPAKSNVNIVLPDAWQGTDITISLYNSAGQLVLNTTRSKAAQTETVSVNGLPDGVYIITMKNKDGDIKQEKLQITR